MIDGIDEFAELRANPALAGMTDEQIRQMINSPSAVVNGNSSQDPYAYNSMTLAPGASTDYGVQAPNPYMSPAGNQFDFFNVQELATPNSYNSMSLAPGSNIEGSTGPNQYQSAADGTFTNSYQEAPTTVQQLTTTGPSKVMNTVSQGVNLYNQVKPIIASAKAALAGGAGAAAAGTAAGTAAGAGAAGAAAGAGAGAGLAALAPLAPVALGVGALLYMKNKKKKKRERQKAKEEAQYKSRKLEQKQDLIDANQDYMEMASKYNNTYDIS